MQASELVAALLCAIFDKEGGDGPVTAEKNEVTVDFGYGKTKTIYLSPMLAVGGDEEK